jgi:hypothetical protein
MGGYRASAFAFGQVIYLQFFLGMVYVFAAVLLECRNVPIIGRHCNIYKIEDSREMLKKVVTMVITKLIYQQFR